MQSFWSRARDSVRSYVGLSVGPSVDRYHLIHDPPLPLPFIFTDPLVDLCFLPDVQKRAGANSCILVMLDTFSRLAYASFQRNKTSLLTFQNFEKCLKHFSDDDNFPTYHLIACDRGTG